MMTKTALFTTAGLALALALPPAAASQIAKDVSEVSQLDQKQERKPATTNGGAISIGQNVDGSLTRGTATYSFEGRAGQRLRAALDSDAFDTVLRLRGPDGFEMENDDWGGTLNSLIDAELPSNGTYSLVVSSYGGDGRGAFRLGTMDPANPVDGAAPQIRLGQTLTGALDRDDATSLTGQAVDYYAFAGRAGQRVTFDLGSDAIDTYLSVYLPDGRTEINDDIRGLDDTNSRLSITLPMDGTYHVAASSFNRGERGAYTLRLSEADASVRTVRPATGNARVFALSVGVADYERISPLNRTDEDAERVTAALRQTGVLAPESVTLVNHQATRANFRRALNDLSNAMGEDDLLLVFFSGHGEKVENMTTERDGSAETIELFDAALHDYELADWMSGIDGRMLLVLDSCFAGGFDQVVRSHNERMGIFSSDEDVLSLVASGEKSGGYISHIFRQALEGAADMDADSAISAGELGEYMRREFYRMVLEEPLATDAEDFRDMQTPGWQHIVVDRGGDGMPHSQVLMNFGSAGPVRVASAN